MQKSTKEDKLKSFIDNEESNTNVSQTTNNEFKSIKETGAGLQVKVGSDYFEKEIKSQFINIDVNQLPCGIYYPYGTEISFRPCKTKEIESFAVINENNPIDRMNKMDELLESVVKIKYMDGTEKNGKAAYFLDRDTLILLVSRGTFQQRKIEFKKPCSCGKDVIVDVLPKNFKLLAINDKYKGNFDNSIAAYVFKSKNGDNLTIKPPKITLQDTINLYVMKRVLEDKVPKEKINQAFLDFIAWTSPDVDTYTYEQLLQKEYEFEQFSAKKFSAAYTLLEDYIKPAVGVEYLKSKCECGLELHTEFRFPAGVRDLFVDGSALDEYYE